MTARGKTPSAASKLMPSSICVGTVAAGCSEEAVPAASVDAPPEDEQAHRASRADSALPTRSV